jgi:tetratricopeptide (TPR) repeat protein
MKPVSLAVLLLLALAASPRASSAQPSDPKAAAAADASGRAHFQRGQRLSARGDYAGAYREFAAGYAVTGRPLFLFNMGEAARASGDVAKARESYLEFLRVDPRSALAATVQARLTELDSASGTRGGSTPSTSTDVSRGASPAPRSDVPPLLPRSAVPPREPPASVIERAPPERVAMVRDGESAPLWKKWPFWAVVGGAIAGGVAVYAVTRGTASACGTGCSELNFR